MTRPPDEAPEQVQVDFAGPTGQVVSLAAAREGASFRLLEWSVEVPGIAPGALLGARLLRGRHVFDGRLEPGPLVAGSFEVLCEDEEDAFECLSALDDVFEEIRAHGDHFHFVADAASVPEAEALLERFHDEYGLHLGFDDALEEAKLVRLDGLPALARLFRALSDEEVPSDRTECGHLHAWHVASALDVESDPAALSLTAEGLDAGLASLLDAPGDAPVEDDLSEVTFRSLPEVLSRRVPVNLGTATLVDDRALEALSDLASEYSVVIEIEARISRDEDDHRPAGLWVEAVVGVFGDDDELETVGLVDLPFDLHGSRLDVSESTGLGVTMWATRLRGHDPSVLCFHLPPEPDEVRSPLGRALLETHERLRSALRDYALVQMVQERDGLLDLVSTATHAHDEHEADEAEE